MRRHEIEEDTCFRISSNWFKLTKINAIWFKLIKLNFKNNYFYFCRILYESNNKTIRKKKNDYIKHFFSNTKEKFQITNVRCFIQKNLKIQCSCINTFELRSWTTKHDYTFIIDDKNLLKIWTSKFENFIDRAITNFKMHINHDDFSKKSKFEKNAIRNQLECFNMKSRSNQNLIVIETISKCYSKHIVVHETNIKKLT